MSKYGIVGDEYGVEVPETVIDKEELVAERNAAKFSKSKEYQQLKEHMESRIDFYQSFLPSGKAVLESEDLEKLGKDWVIANTIITEFRAVLGAYEAAKQAVEDSERS